MEDAPIQQSVGKRYGPKINILGLFITALVLGSLASGTFFVTQRSSNVASLFDTRQQATGNLYCPGRTCPDGWSYPEDQNTPQATCEQRHAEACVGHETVSPPGSTTGTSCIDCALCGPLGNKECQNGTSHECVVENNACGGAKWCWRPGGDACAPAPTPTPAPATSPSNTCSSAWPTASCCYGRQAGAVSCGGVNGTCNKTTQNGDGTWLCSFTHEGACGNVADGAFDTTPGACRQCNADGTGWNYCPNDCRANSPQCLGLAATPTPTPRPVCAANQTRCTNGQVETCKPDLTGFGAPVNCPMGEICDITRRSCTAPSCDLGETICEDRPSGTARRRTCKADRTGFNAPVDCPTGRVCGGSDGNLCVLPAASPSISPSPSASTGGGICKPGVWNCNSIGLQNGTGCGAGCASSGSCCGGPLATPLPSATGTCRTGLSCQSINRQQATGCTGCIPGQESCCGALLSTSPTPAPTSAPGCYGVSVCSQVGRVTANSCGYCEPGKICCGAVITSPTPTPGTCKPGVWSCNSIGLQNGTGCGAGCASSGSCCGGPLATPLPTPLPTPIPTPDTLLATAGSCHTVQSCSRIGLVPSASCGNSCGAIQVCCMAAPPVVPDDTGTTIGPSLGDGTTIGPNTSSSLAFVELKRNGASCSTDDDCQSHRCAGVNAGRICRAPIGINDYSPDRHYFDPSTAQCIQGSSGEYATLADCQQYGVRDARDRAVARQVADTADERFLEDVGHIGNMLGSAVSGTYHFAESAVLNHPLSIAIRVSEENPELNVIQSLAVGTLLSANNILGAIDESEHIHSNINAVWNDVRVFGTGISQPFRVVTGQGLDPSYGGEGAMVPLTNAYALGDAALRVVSLGFASLDGATEAATDWQQSNAAANASGSNIWYTDDRGFHFTPQYWAANQDLRDSTIEAGAQGVTVAVTVAPLLGITPESVARAVATPEYQASFAGQALQAPNQGLNNALGIQTQTVLGEVKITGAMDRFFTEQTANANTALFGVTQTTDDIFENAILQAIYENSVNFTGDQVSGYVQGELQEGVQDVFGLAPSTP